MVAGSSSTALPEFESSVSGISISAIGSGGTNDWWGRAYICRRPSDNAVVMVYRRGTSHMSAASELEIRFRPEGGAWTAENTKIGGGAVTGFPMVPSAGNINAGEGMPIVVPPNAPHAGRIIVLLWRVDGSGDWPEDPKGTQQAHSDDGGNTWSSPVAISMSGFADLEHTFVTDDWFPDPNTGDIYTCARVYNLDNPTDSYAALVKSTDGGDTWAYVSDITSAGSDTHEVGLTYLGGSDILALVGSFNNDETIQAISTDMGLTWTTSDVTSTAASITRRHKLYTVAYLLGEAGWWNDNRLVAFCFENQTPGSSQDRRNAILVGSWNRSAHTATWEALHYLDTTADDGGYGDVYYADSPGAFEAVAGKGTLAACTLNLYEFDMDFRA